MRTRTSMVRVALGALVILGIAICGRIAFAQPGGTAINQGSISNCIVAQQAERE